MPLLRLTYDLSKRVQFYPSTQRHIHVRCNELPVSVEGFFSTESEAAEALRVAITAYISAAQDEQVVDEVMQGFTAEADEGLDVELQVSAARSTTWVHESSGPSLRLGRIRHPDRFLSRIGCRQLPPRNGYVPLVRVVDGEKLIRLVDIESFEIGDFESVLKNLGYIRSDFDGLRDSRPRR